MKNINLINHKSTLQVGNRVWIKKFENGIKLRTKGEGEITLETYEVFEMLYHLRKFCKKYNPTIFLTALDLTYLWEKYPETKEFVERLLTDEINDEEKLKIHDKYIKRMRIVDSLEENGYKRN